MNDASEELLTVRETARRLGVHENTVRAYVKKGLLPDARVPGTRFHKFRASDVERLKTQRGAAAPTLLADRQVASPELVNASQLAQWPNVSARDAQAYFPELMRRLLYETPGVGQISIRAGDGVGLAGDDGLAVFEEQTKLLPRGRLRFEFGTDKDCKRKASKEYDSRKSTAAPGEVFVFASPRRWQGKGAWAAERRGDGLFDDVIALDADDLEGWLQLAPIAHIWISERLGLRPRDAVTLEAWWARFSASTEPLLPLKLFTAGRSAQASKLRSLLADDPHVISIQTEWTDDALGFVMGAITTNGEDMLPSASVVTVASPEVWERITSTPGAGTLVPLYDDPDVDRAIASGRHVVAIVDDSTARRRSVDIRLPRPSRSEAAEAFKEASVEWRRADRLAVLARRSMPALTRRLSRSERVRQPAWSKPPLADQLAALMLANRWADASDDIEALSDLAQSPSGDLQRSLVEACKGADPAIRKTAGTYVFSSLEEAFLEFGDRVSDDLITRWSKIAVEVLLDPDPFDGMTSAERIAAQMKGGHRRYSHTLRRGFADGLAVAGAIELPSESDHLAMAANAIVREVLSQAAADTSGRTWASIADLLPLLAEASPNAFLSALEDDLATAAPTVGRLFLATNDPFALGSTSEQHHLLWALEILCWSPEHLIRSIQILTKLCRYQLPKNSGNRPLASMSAVLCGWVRNTGADLAARLQAIDACHLIDPATGWELIKQLWPTNHGWISPPSAPRYQLWKPSGDSITRREWIDFTHGMTDRALSWAETDHSALPWLVEALTTAAPTDTDRIVAFLQSLADDAALDAETQLTLFTQVRDVTARHQRFQDAEWAMTPERIDQLVELTEALRPADDLRKFTYLFGWHPDLGEADEPDYEAYDAKLHALRLEALDAFFAQPDAWEQLAGMAERAESPAQVGWALSDYARDDALEVMLEWSTSELPALRQASATWTGRHLAISGPADLIRAIDHAADATSLRPFILNVPTESRFWNALANYPEAAAIFWAETPFEMVPDQDLTEAITELVRRKRAWAAINVASHGVYRASTKEREVLPSTELIASVLTAALTEDPGASAINQMTSHYVGTLLDYLAAEGMSDDDLASLEFGYFRLLEHGRQTPALDRALAASPTLFVDLVTRAFRGVNEPRRQSKDADPMASHAWWVLHGWHGFPGRQPDGSVDAAAMKDWIQQARLQLSDLDRGDIGDELIGQTFTHAPAGVDGIWPAEPIREVIETIGSRNLENGVITGRINSRGVTSRGIYDGGAQERKLADEYKSASGALQAQWPRTARILRAIAESYERDAVHHDAAAQRDQDLD